MILAVDDNRDAREFLAILLRKQGYVVHTADGGTSALEIARKHLPRLFILDEQMPGMTGTELLARIRADASLAQAKVIFLSAAFEHGNTKKALEMGALDWLVKGIHGPAHIIASVSRALAS